MQTIPKLTQLQKHTLLSNKLDKDSPLQMYVLTDSRLLFGSKLFMFSHLVLTYLSEHTLTVKSKEIIPGFFLDLLSQSYPDNKDINSFEEDKEEYLLDLDNAIQLLEFAKIIVYEGKKLKITKLGKSIESNKTAFYLTLLRIYLYEVDWRVNYDKYIINLQDYVNYFLWFAHKMDRRSFHPIDFRKQLLEEFPEIRDKVTLAQIKEHGSLEKILDMSIGLQFLLDIGYDFGLYLPIDDTDLGETTELFHSLFYEVELVKNKSFSMSNPIAQLLEGQNFENIDDANAFLEKHINIGSTLDDIEKLLPEPKTNAEKAKKMMREASYTNIEAERLAKIAEAELLDPHNIEILTQLGNNAATAEQAMTFYQKAIKYGEIELGGDAGMEEKLGHFWSMHETRPYMKAKVGLIEIYKVLGKFEKAEDECYDVLELNSDDNLGVRYILSGLLTNARKINDALELYKNFDDEPSITFLYDLAINLFNRFGDVKKARDAAKKAFACNPYVIDLVVGNKEVGRFESYALGSPEEADFYIQTNFQYYISNKNMLQSAKWLVGRFAKSSYGRNS